MLLALARQLKDPTVSATYSTALALLAATGMRVGEALALDDTDVDLKQSLITVRRTKFGKSRLVPLHPTSRAALQQYVRRRNRLCPLRQTLSFFVSSTGRRVLHQKFHHVFLCLVACAGIRGPAGRRARLHDLRHTFAVRTFGDWYRQASTWRPDCRGWPPISGTLAPFDVLVSHRHSGAARFSQHTPERVWKAKP